MAIHRLRLAVTAALLLTVFACARRDMLKPTSAVGYYETSLGRMPAEAFGRIEEAELERFFELTPGVIDALERSGFDMSDFDEEELLGDLPGFIERLGEVGEVRSVLSDSGSGWAEYRVTLLKVTTTTAALVEQVFGDLVVGLLGMSDAPVGDSDQKNSGAATGSDEELSLLDLVPEENVELLLEHEEELEALEDLFK